MKNILNLNNIAARKFFLSQKAYTNIDLPDYFVFKDTLAKIEGIIKNNIATKKELVKANELETTNHVLYGNKDGKYAWRKYQLINPFLYISLVNVITEKDNWKLIKDRFNDFQSNNNIKCESVPVLPKEEQRQKAAQISWWVNNVEKKSISLSLQYKYLFQTDIASCYSSIYTHSISWAIHTKPIAKAHRKDNLLLGNKIDWHIQSMSHGQTNGIPEGNVLMDFIAEMVLGYVDEELSKILEKELKGKNYYILRYRDDYRIFVNDSSDGDRILKCLSELLISLSFHLNIHKTEQCGDVVNGSIKKDKIHALKYGMVPDKLSKNYELFRQLLIINSISTDYPNSGVIAARLSKIRENAEDTCFRRQQDDALVGILINIAYSNPRSFHLLSYLVSKCLEGVPIKRQIEILEKIQEKICTLPNIGLYELWIQRMAIKLKTKLKLNEGLCKNAYNNVQNLFEYNWIDSEQIRDLIRDNSFVSRSIVNKMPKSIQKEEVQLFIY